MSHEAAQYSDRRPPCLSCWRRQCRLLVTLVPGWLLGRQEEKLRAQANTVPVDAVRPYGDDYDEMKQELLGGIRTMFAREDCKYEDVAEKDVSDTVSAASGFLQTWATRRSSTASGSGMTLCRGRSSFKITSSASDSYALTLDVMTGQGPMAFITHPYPKTVSQSMCASEWMAPTVPVVGYLWQSLRETYQSRCGLSFNVILESGMVHLQNAADDDAAISVMDLSAAMPR